MKKLHIWLILANSPETGASQQTKAHSYPLPHALTHSQICDVYTAYTKNEKKKRKRNEQRSLCLKSKCAIQTPSQNPFYTRNAKYENCLNPSFAHIHGHYIVYKFIKYIFCTFACVRIIYIVKLFRMSVCVCSRLVEHFFINADISHEKQNRTS